jgi:hypothetical protein
MMVESSCRLKRFLRGAASMFRVAQPAAAETALARMGTKVSIEARIRTKHVCMRGGCETPARQPNRDGLARHVRCLPPCQVMTRRLPRLQAGSTRRVYLWGCYCGKAPVVLQGACVPWPPQNPARSFTLRCEPSWLRPLPCAYTYTHARRRALST